MVAFLEQLSRRLNRWVEFIVVAMGMSMATIVGIQVFSRYVLNHSLFWSEEAARYLLVWLTFLGASIAYRRKAHPGVDLFFARMNPPLRRLCRLLVHLTSLGLFGIMIVGGWHFAWFVRMQISPALAIPKWIILAIIPVSGVVFLVHCLAFMARVIGRDAGDV
jgi:TRAP-type C4-dicarboxylate transport system permease small subunit